MLSLTRNTVTAATLLMLTAGSALAQSAPPSPTSAPKERRQPISATVRQHLLDGRIAMIKTALQLTPDQEKMWPAVEKVIRDNAAQRSQLMADARANRHQAGGGAGEPSQRLEIRAKMGEARAQEATRLADALKPLEATFSSDQKAVERIIVARQGGQHYRQERNRG